MKRTISLAVTFMFTLGFAASAVGQTCDPFIATVEHSLGPDHEPPMPVFVVTTSAGCTAEPPAASDDGVCTAEIELPPQGRLSGEEALERACQFLVHQIGASCGPRFSVTVEACEPSHVRSALSLAQIRPLDAGWELTAAPVRTIQEMSTVEPEVLTATDAVLARHAAQARQDRVWYAADGERYEALFVLDDGTAYGRRGGAIARTPADGDFAEPADGGSTGLVEDESAAAVELLQPEARIGTDTSNDRRSRISSTNALTSFPSQVIGALSGNGDTQGAGCTGAKVGPRHVLTAAHCVMTSSGTITTSGRFNPGQTNTTALNGSIPWSGVLLRDYRVSRDFDYALLYLQNTAAVASTGYLGVAYWASASSYAGRNATLRGYPCGPNRTCGETTSQRCAASPRPDRQCDGWMYSHTRPMTSSTMTGSQLRIDNDGSSGQSGSPIYGSVSGLGTSIFGVYWGSVNGNNQGARFRSTMWNDICSWIAQHPSSFVVHPSCN